MHNLIVEIEDGDIGQNLKIKSVRNRNGNRT